MGGQQAHRSRSAAQPAPRHAKHEHRTDGACQRAKGQKRLPVEPSAPGISAKHRRAGWRSADEAESRGGQRRDKPFGGELHGEHTAQHHIRKQAWHDAKRPRGERSARCIARALRAKQHDQHHQQAEYNPHERHPCHRMPTRRKKMPGVFSQFARKRCGILPQKTGNCCLQEEKLHICVAYLPVRVL